VTIDEYVAWAAGVDASEPDAGRPEGRALLELGLGFAREVGEVAGMLARWLRDGERQPGELADGLGEVAYSWARLCVVTGVAPSTLLARSRAHVEWRRAGRPAGGPTPGAPMSIEQFTAWAVGGAGDEPSDRPGGEWLGDVGLALVGDAGEVVECLRKLAREGDAPRERLAGELGDVWRYWSRLCVAAGLTPAELLEQSRTRVERRLARDRSHDQGPSVELRGP
jgi:NTP pyrophosphatase (non-canonical NTP hydrolase)